MALSGDTLDLTVHALRELGPTLLRLTWVPAFFVAIAAYFSNTYFLEPFFITSHPSSASAQVTETLARVLFEVGAAIPLFVLGVSWMSFEVVQITSEWMRRGEAPSNYKPNEFGKQGARCLGWAIYTSFICAVPGLIGLGMLYLGSLSDPNSSDWLVPFAIILMFVQLFWMLYYISYRAISHVALIVEDIGVIAAVRRSKDLLAGRKGMGAIPANNMLKQLLIVIIIGLAIGFAVAVPFSLVNVEGILNSLFGSGWISNGILLTLNLLPFFVAIWGMTLIWSLSTTFTYFQCRSRFEGMDIEILAQSLELGK